MGQDHLRQIFGLLASQISPQSDKNDGGILAD